MRASGRWRMLRFAGLTVLALAFAEARAQTPVCGNGIVESGEECDDANGATVGCCAACARAAEETPCDDGRACTRADVCTNGTCAGTPTDALCGLRLVQLTCYRVGRGPKGSPRFVRRRGEVVVDELKSGAADPQKLDLRKPEVVCSRGGESGAAGDSSDLEGYVVKPSRTEPPQARFVRREITMQHALGTLPLVLTRPRRLLVPSNLIRGPSGATPPEGAQPRFKCYRARPARLKRKDTKPPDTFTSGTVTLTDMRGGPWIYTLSTATAVCVPELAAAVSELPEAHAGYLTCHRAKVARANPAEARAVGGLVSTANRFGEETLTLRKLAEICLPSVRREPSAAEDPAPPSFTFLRESGDVNEALAMIWRLGFEAPATPAEAGAAQAKIDAATTVIQQHLGEAQAALLTAVRGLESDDHTGYTSLLRLLRIAGDTPALLDHARDVLLAEPLAEPAEDDPVLPDRLVRFALIDVLVHHARDGSEVARGRILDAVRSPDVGIRGAAVRHYYTLTPGRRLAQRTLRRRLDPASRYLLYVQ